MKDFDNNVGIWCKQRNIKYTKYCDDKTFSEQFSANEITSFITPKLKEMGFILNTKIQSSLVTDKAWTLNELNSNK